MKEGLINRLNQIKYLAQKQKSKKAFWQVIPMGLISEKFSVKESDLSLDDLKHYSVMMIDLMCVESGKISFLADRQIELNEEED